MSEGPEAGGDNPLGENEELLKRRRQRNLALAWVLGALVILFFIVTVVKLGGNIAQRAI